MKRCLCAIIVGLFSVLPYACAPTYDEAKYEAAMYNGCEEISNIECLKAKGWTFEKTTFEHIKNESLKYTTKYPTTVMQKRWAHFIEQYQTGDDIWYFSSPHDDWIALVGQAGYIILRSGKLVTKIKTRVS